MNDKHKVIKPETRKIENAHDRKIYGETVRIKKIIPFPYTYKSGKISERKILVTNKGKFFIRQYVTKASHVYSVGDVITIKYWRKPIIKDKRIRFFRNYILKVIFRLTKEEVEKKALDNKIRM